MDDKFFVTKETAEKMKESLKEFVSRFEKENGYCCFEKEYLDMINEGLDNGINMNPFLILNNNKALYEQMAFDPFTHFKYDKEPVFSIHHAVAYIQAVKDGNEDMARSVLAVRTDEDAKRYVPIFEPNHLKLANELREIAKKPGEPNKFDVLFSLDEPNEFRKLYYKYAEESGPAPALPAFSHYQIRELYSLVKEHPEINVDTFLETDKYGQCIYNDKQMKYLVTAAKEGFPLEPLVEIRKSIDDGKHVSSYHGSEDMKEVEKKMEARLYEMMDQRRRNNERGEER